MERALAAYAEVADGCIQRVVLGDMLDLGTATKKSHHRILNLAIVLGFSEIYLVGEHFAAALSSLINAPKNIRAYSSCDEVSDALSTELASGDTIFLKGSRGMALEKILENLKKKGVV
jgi:UDP-N-acetylmuramoyl-tripeptide--D-alanyl-D-alanine ligase